MKSLITVIFAVLFCATTNAQKVHEDSLTNSEKLNKNDLIKIALNSNDSNKRAQAIKPLKNDLFSNNLHFRKVAKYILQGYGYSFGEREDRQ